MTDFLGQKQETTEAKNEQHEKVNFASILGGDITYLDGNSSAPTKTLHKTTSDVKATTEIFSKDDVMASLAGEATSLPANSP